MAEASAELSFRNFPRPDGAKDLVIDSERHVYKRGRKNVLSCAYALVALDNQGLRMPTGPCTGTPTSPCQHYLTEEEFLFNWAWKRTKLLACQMKKDNLFKGGMTTDHFVACLIITINKYCPRMGGRWDLNAIVGQREAAMNFIRTHDRPWASSLDLEEEVDMEIKKDPKFEGLLCEAREMFDWDCAFKDAKWNKRFRDMLDEYADDYDYVEDIESVLLHPVLHREVFEGEDVGEGISVRLNFV